MFEEQIKAALKKRGLDENLFSKIKVEKEEEIDEAVVDLKIELKISEGLQKERDILISKTAEQQRVKFAKEKEDLLKQYEGKKDEKKPTLDGEKNDPPEWVKSIQESHKSVTERLEKIESARTKDSLDKMIFKTLEAEKLPKEMAKYITVESENGIKDAIEAVKKDFFAVQKSENLKNLNGNGIKDSKGAESATVELAKAAAAQANQTQENKGPLQVINLLKTKGDNTS